MASEEGRDVASSLDREDIPENGSLLFIEISTANNIISSDLKAMKNPHVRFRVLYIEEEAKSSLFRAKTPIYTGEYVAAGNSTLNPAFNDPAFKFEMLYPEGMQEFRGEIAISLYSADIDSSSQEGGSGSGAVFFGQVTFPISSIVKSGTVKVANGIQGLSGRCIQGNFPLLSQSGKGIQAVASDFKPSINVSLHLFWWDIGDVEDQDNTALEDQDAVPSVNTSKRGNSKRRSESVGISKAPTKASVGMSHNKVIPVMSGNAKKKMETNFRIERDNLAMLQRLEKLTGKKHDDAYVDATKRVNKAVFTEEDYVNVVNKSGKWVKKLVNSLTDAEALEIINKLKPDINNLKIENDSLKGLVNQQKAILRKYDNTLSKSSDFNLSNVTSCALKGREFSAGGINKYFYSRSHILNSYGLDESKIIDKEILDLVMEHEALQAMRKALVENIKTSKSNERSSTMIGASSREKVKSFLRRMNLLYPHQKFVSDLLGSDDIKIANEGEANLVESLNRFRSEMAIMESFKKEELFCTELLNSLEELKSIIASLEKTRDRVKKELQIEEFERDAADERFSRLVDNNYIHKMRDMLINIRSVRSEYRKKRELNDVKTAIDNAEFTLVQLKIAKQEREFKLKESLYNKDDLL